MSSQYLGCRVPKKLPIAIKCVSYMYLTSAYNRFSKMAYRFFLERLPWIQIILASKEAWSLSKGEHNWRDYLILCWLTWTWLLFAHLAGNHVLATASSMSLFRANWCSTKAVVPPFSVSLIIDIRRSTYNPLHKYWVNFGDPLPCTLSPCHIHS